jgi:DNA helicase-2/ATP-dependent DNA helicase PcrA
MVASGERTWSDFALFYRVNALSRELELALMRHQVPYQVAAGVAFYERTEVKDVLSYLRLIHNPKDEVSFRRVVNKPVRGIGKKSLAQLIEWATSNALTFLEAAARADELPGLPKRAAKSLRDFAAIIDECSPAAGCTVERILRNVIERSGLANEWRGNTSEQDQQRLANIQELVTAAAHYDQSMKDEASLEGFLETTSLVSDVDALDDSAGHVTLMTLHAAKGLEFPVVYIIAVEQNLIPHERSLKTGEMRELEEERRLLFVGMTRAKERLFLTQTRQRDFRGRTWSTIPSDFIMEIPLDLRDFSREPFAVAATEAHESNETPEREGDSSQGGHDESEQRSDSTRELREGSRPLRLTTAAELLNGSLGDLKPTPLPAGFAVGMTVRHPQYGLGTIVDVDGFAKNRKVTVQFRDGDRRQTFVVSKSPLQPVGLE